MSYAKGPPVTNDLQTAHDAALARFANDWFGLSPAEQTQAIYRELRLIDERRAAENSVPKAIIAGQT
jgi:hypothetical protein